MRDLEIRPAAPDDVPVLLGLIRALADFEKLSAQVMTNADLLRDALFGERPAAEALLAFEAGAPAGFAVYFQNYSTFTGRPGLYLEDLYVTPEKRGRGIGKALLLAVNRVALERGCGRFEWTVLDWNTGAIGFYESLGGKVLPDWRVVRLDRAGIESLAQRV